MTIYTKKGDTGYCQLATGQLVNKTDSRIQAYGLLDTTSAQIAKCRAIASSDIVPILTNILNKLANCAAITAGYNNINCSINFDDVSYLEEQIDRLSTIAPLPKYIIIPSGPILALELNLARTFTRQAELALWQVHETQATLPPELLAYINRLSDFLFVLGNYVVAQEGISPEKWHS